MPEKPEFGKGLEDYRQAEWLAQRLRGRWRYDHAAQQWHHWDLRRWAPDTTERIHREIARVAGLELGKGGGAESETKRLNELLKMPVQERVLKALRTFDEYSTDGSDWDTEPYLLGVKNGIVDLRSNTLIEKPEPTVTVTRSTGHDFEAITEPAQFDQRAPKFMKAMREWTSGDEDLAYFLLFWFGASMFGFSPEQRFLLMTGIGRNGKGALKHAILHATGEYSDELDASMYMRNKFGAPRSSEARADLIKLKGMRITFFSEPQGGKFNDELLKAHTGGDRISARALYSNILQSWDPTHSISFLTNDLPEVEDVGPSMAERVMVADFRESFEGDRRDAKLYDKLEAEAEGILAILCWAAQVWYVRWNEMDSGLVLPQRVVEQSKAFIERNDPVSNWLNERCRRGRDMYCPSQVGYESYLQWHIDAGMPGEPMSSVKWAQVLLKKGMTKRKTELGMRWNGFALLGAVDLAERDVDEDENP